MNAETFLNEAFWNERYLSHQTHWDTGKPSTPLAHLIEGLADKQMHILIPGCGNAYEGAYLSEKGFRNITLLDISAVVTDHLKDVFAHDEKVTVIHQDFFDHDGQYHLILEQTFFCALHPSLREKYAAKMHSLLHPDGCITGVLFNVEFENNPPFGGSREEYEALFSKNWNIEKMEPCYNSIKPRMGRELFFRLKPKDLI